MAVVVCRLEYLSYKQTKAVLLINYIGIVLGVAGMAVLVWLKFENNGLSFFRNNHLTMANTIIFSFCIALLLTSMVIYAWHVYKARHHHWDPMRKMVVTTNSLLMLALLLAVCCCLARNVMLVGVSCWWLFRRDTVSTVVLYAVMESAWNVLFAILVMQIRLMCPRVRWAQVVQRMGWCGKSGWCGFKRRAKEEDATVVEKSNHCLTRVVDTANGTANGTANAERNGLSDKTATLPDAATLPAPDEVESCVVEYSSMHAVKEPPIMEPLHSSINRESNGAVEPSLSSTNNASITQRIPNASRYPSRHRSSWFRRGTSSRLEKGTSEALPVSQPGHAQLPDSMQPRGWLRVCTGSLHVFVVWAVVQSAIIAECVSRAEDAQLDLVAIDNIATEFESTRPAEVNDVLMNYLERTTGHRDVWKDMIRNDTMLLPWKGIPYYVGDAENQTVSQQLYGNLPNSTYNNTNVYRLPFHDAFSRDIVGHDSAIVIAQTDFPWGNETGANGTFALISAMSMLVHLGLPYYSYCLDSPVFPTFDRAYKAVVANAATFRQHFGLDVSCRNAPAEDMSCQMFSCPTALSDLWHMIVINVMQVLYLVLFAWHTMHALSALKQYNYSRYRFANLYVRLQMREGLVVFGTVILLQTLTFYIHPNNCGSQFIEQLGVAPVLFMMAVMLLARGWYSAPIVEQLHQLLASEKQQFAWCEGDLKQAMMQRGCDTEPMFCFETALRAMFWTIAAYRETQDIYAGEPVFTAEHGCQMGLVHSHGIHIWQHEDVAALVAWGPGFVVVTFRGTVSLRNIRADASLWQVQHPRMPWQRRWQRGPHVHQGFWRLWSAIEGEALDHMMTAVRNAAASNGVCSKRVRVLLTGHSLGGALATLAAWDVHTLIAATEPALQGRVDVQVYTFGAPRVGNHAFARLFKAAVPSTWDIVNDQDVIPKASKWLRVYKRSGHRVIINRVGDIIVRPTWMELNVKNSTYTSVDDHLIRSYRGSLAAIVQAQYSQLKSLEDGLQGVHRLWQHKAGQQLMTWVLELNLDALDSDQAEHSAVDAAVKQSNAEQLDREPSTMSEAVRGTVGGLKDAVMEQVTAVKDMMLQAKRIYGAPVDVDEGRQDSMHGSLRSPSLAQSTNNTRPE